MQRFIPAKPSKLLRRLIYILLLLIALCCVLLDWQASISGFFAIVGYVAYQQQGKRFLQWLKQ